MFSINSFLKKHWILILLLSLIPIVSMVIFCAIFWCKLNDVSAWASIIAGLFTYIGTVILSLFVYYHTWRQVGQQKNLEKLNIVVEQRLSTNGFKPFTRNEIDKSKYSFEYYRVKDSRTKFKKDFYYFELLINNINNNPNSYFSFEIENVYYIDKGENVKSFDYFSVISDTNYNEPVDYKQKVDCFVGSDDVSLFKQINEGKPITFYISLKITDAKNNISYLELEYYLADFFGCNHYFYSESQYKKRTEKLKLTYNSKLYCIYKNT